MQGIIDKGMAQPEQEEEVEQQVEPGAEPGAKPEEPAQPEGKPGKFRTNVVSALPENLREPFERVVVAGMQVMFSKNMKEDIEREMARDVPMFQKLAESVAGLMGLLAQQSKGMPPEVVIPAAIELAHEAAAFVNESGMGKVSPEELKEATQYLIVLLLKGQGVADEQITQVMSGGQQAQAEQPAQPQGGEDGAQLQ